MVLSKAQKADVQRIEAYLNTIGTLKTRFLQLSSNGSTAEGDLYLSRPGRMRIQYDDPVPVEIVATGTFLVYHDKDLEQVTWVGLDSTPAGILLAETISFKDQLSVTGFEQKAGALRLSVVKADDPLGGSLTLTFSDNPLRLRKWTVVDAQGLLTSVALLNPRTGLALEPSLFEFTDPYKDDANPRD